MVNKKKLGLKSKFLIPLLITSQILSFSQTASLTLEGALRDYWWEKKNKTLQFPLWLSRLRTQLASTRMWVQSLASFSGLRIQCCHKFWGRSKMQLEYSITMAVA